MSASIIAFISIVSNIAFDSFVLYLSKQSFGFISFASLSLPTPQPALAIMKPAQARFEPSELTQEDYAEVQRLLSEVFSTAERPALIGSNNERLELPEPVYQMMRQLLRFMSERKTVFIIPEDESCTTQSAADMLGVSRPFLIKLLSEGKMNFHHVGRHRRIYFKDLMQYQRTRDSERRAILDSLTDEIMAHDVEDNACDDAS